MVKCGTNHCALLTEQGRIYTWGSCEKGALSSPSQADEFEPTEARIHTPIAGGVTFFKEIDCGP
jgi:alpha-tubulin suppressor-like RCC1 family protein